MSHILSDKDVVVAFSTKADGDMSRTNSNRLHSMARRRQFLETNGIGDSSLALIRPSHCANIELLSTSSPNRLLRQIFLGKRLIDTDFDNYWDGSDGVLTLEPLLAVALVSADCIPVVIWDEASCLHGILHVGLLGALNNLVAGLPTVMANIGVPVERVRVRLGPSIDAGDYVISTSGLWLAIEDQVRAKAPDLLTYTASRADALTFDVRRLVLDQLSAAGINPANVEVTPGSTAAPDSQYFSHHMDRSENDGVTRRFMSVVGWRTNQ
jgi:copper oxidase (laccase) domain-containing protein